MAETLRDRVAQIIMQQAQQPLIPTARPVSALEGNAAAYAATDAILALVAASPAAGPGVAQKPMAWIASKDGLVRTHRVEPHPSSAGLLEAYYANGWEVTLLGPLVPQTPASGEGE